MFSLWKGRFAFLPLGATLQWFFFNIRLTLDSTESKYLSFIGVAPKLFATRRDLSWLGGTSGASRLRCEFHFVQALIYLRKKKEQHFSEEALSMLRPVLLLFQVCIYFMRMVLECFIVTPCQMTKVASLFFSFCDIFPDLSLCKSCHLLLAATAVSFRGWWWGRGVPGVCVVVPGHWHRLSALAHHFLPLAKHLGSAENKKH